MKSLYISSTRKDLDEYLRAVTEALRNCDYNVDAMERYPARDDRPKAVSEADAAACDIYVGIFAWKFRSRIIRMVSQLQNWSTWRPDGRVSPAWCSCWPTMPLGLVPCATPNRSRMPELGYATYGNT
jgi:hypothetical protein